MQKVLKHFCKADIKEYDVEVSSKKLKHGIKKAHCQCNWQRILFYLIKNVRIIFIVPKKLRFEKPSKAYAMH